MKTKHIITAILLMCATICFGQTNWFEQYSDKQGVTYVSISPDILQLMPETNMGMDNVNLKDVVSKLTGFVILTADDGNVAKQLAKDAKTNISNGYTEFMKIKDSSNNVTFYIKKDGQYISEMIMSVEEPNSYTLMKLDGKFTLEDISKIAGSN